MEKQIGCSDIGFNIAHLIISHNPEKIKIFRDNLEDSLL